MTYAVALPDTQSQDIKAGQFVPEESAWLAKFASKAEGLQWVESNKQRIRVLVGDSPIVFTTNRGKVMK